MTIAAILLVLAATPQRPDLALIYDAASLDLRTCQALDGRRVVVRADLRWVSLSEHTFSYGVRNNYVDEMTLITPSGGPDNTGLTVTLAVTVRVVRHPRMGQRLAYTEVQLIAAPLSSTSNE
jgi:hypothetical protein